MEASEVEVGDIPVLPGYEDVTAQQLMTLWARATNEMKYPDFFSDPASVELFNKLGLHIFDDYFAGMPDFIGLSVRNRAMHIDEEITSYSQSSGSHLHIVVVGGGLACIQQRLSHIDADWYFVDHPQLNRIRRDLLPQSGLIIDAQAFEDYDWINALPIESGEKLMFIFPSTLYSMDPLSVAEVMAALADSWPGSHFVMDAITSKAQIFIEEMEEEGPVFLPEAYYTVDDIDEEVSVWADEDLHFNVLRSYSLYDTISIRPEWDDLTRKLCMKAMIMRFYNMHHVYHASPDFIGG